MAPRVYLAGPEVFLPNGAEVALRKKALCARHGFEGVFPLDAGVEAAGRTPRQQGLAIHAANEALVRDCALLVANLTPFRGPSADAGTVYELGLARGLGRPVFGYTNAAAGLRERTVAGLEARGAAARRTEDGAWVDEHGRWIEDFGLADNLMLDGAVAASGGELVRAARDLALDDLTGFEACLRQAAAQEALRGAGDA